MAISTITSAGIADNAVTAAKIVAGAVVADVGTDGITANEIVAGAVGSSEIAANAVGTSEIATGGVLPANIAYLGDGSGNLSGTITNQQLHFGTAFTLTDDLTINGDVTLGKVRDDGLGQSITGSGRTLTGTGTLTMGSYVEGGQPGRDDKTAETTSVTGLPGVLGSGVTGGAGLTGSTSLGTVTAGDLSNTAIVYPAGHVVQIRNVVTGVAENTSSTSFQDFMEDTITFTAGNHILSWAF